MMKDNVTSDPSLDWYSWGSWSPCSSACGLGVRWRRRACLKNRRFCPQSSRPNSLFFEKTQIQDCQFSPCVNRTLTENSLISTGDVGISIAISSSIIALVFIVAKTLHCVTNDRRRRGGCCRGSSPENSSPSETPLPESTTPPQSSAQHRSGIENMAGPVYITITQEMITGATASVSRGPGQTDAVAAISPLSRSRTDVRVKRTMSSPSCSSRRDVISFDPNGSVPLTHTPNPGPSSFEGGTSLSNIPDPGPPSSESGTSLSHIPNPGPPSSENGTSLRHIPNPRPPSSESGNRATDQSEVNTNTTGFRSITTDESNSVEEDSAERDAAHAIYSPPSYESIFPMYKRNQTL